MIQEISRGFFFSVYLYMDYFWCPICKRYYLKVFKPYHDTKHKYMIYSEF